MRVPRNHPSATVRRENATRLEQTAEWLTNRIFGWVRVALSDEGMPCTLLPPTGVTLVFVSTLGPGPRPRRGARFADAEVEWAGGWQPEAEANHYPTTEPSETGLMAADLASAEPVAVGAGAGCSRRPGCSTR